MAEEIPDELREELRAACALHERAAVDRARCGEFSERLSHLLGRLEDSGCHRTAAKVMSALLDCNPKEGSTCDRAARVTEKVKGLCRGLATAPAERTRPRR